MKITENLLPKVQVLLSTYNGEKFLSDQIESLINQEGVNISILVRDDGSNDKTIELLNQWQDKGILNWYSGEHLNAALSFIDLLNSANGADYYAFCDQDDVWDSDKLAVAIEKLEKFCKDAPSLYYSSLRLVDENLKTIKIHSIEVKRNLKARYIFSGVAGCTMVFNNQMLLKAKQFCPKGTSIIMHDSWIFKLCIAIGGQTIADIDSHISYRQHGNNTLGISPTNMQKFKRRLYYLLDSRVQDELKELASFYKDQMTAEYKKFTELICNYNKSFINWLKLLFCRGINFHHFGLAFLFRVKVLIIKM